MYFNIGEYTIGLICRVNIEDLKKGLKNIFFLNLDITAALFREENWESTHFHNEKSFTGYGLIFISCLSFIK